MKINLPSLSGYREQFIKDGVTVPLPVVPFAKTGLLAELPLIDKDKTGWPWTEESDPSRYDASIDWPKVTIVTPSYNQNQFLEETIRSVLLQNYPNLEYIILDGGSNDDSASIIEKYAPWLSYWHSKKDSGQSNAINQGFSLGSGKYFAWLNSDDTYLMSTLHTVVSRFLKTGADFVYGYTLNYVTATKQFNRPTKLLAHWDYFIRIPSLSQPSCFWSAAIHQPLWEDLHCSLDYELWLRMVQGTKKSLIKEPLSMVKIHADAKTSDPKMKERWEADHLLICHPDAHGPVPNWRWLSFINHVRIKLYDWLHLR